MPTIYDITAAGTATQIRNIYDCTSSATTTAIQKAYDVTTAGAATLVYQKNQQFYPGAAVTPRNYSTSAAGTFYAICRPTPLIGESSAAYASVNVTPWSYCDINFTIQVCPTYGYLYVGFGNFSSYVMSDFPALTHGVSDIITSAGYYNGYSTTITINVASLSGNYLVGCAAVSRSSVIQATGHVTINSIILR